MRRGRTLSICFGSVLLWREVMGLIHRIFGMSVPLELKMGILGYVVDGIEQFSIAAILYQALVTNGPS